MLPRSEWERCKPWLEAALEYGEGTHTIDDVERAISDRRAFLMAGEKSAMVCEVETYPQKRVLRIWLAGGDLEEIKSSSAQMEAMARELGCSRISINGRRGWERALRDLGCSVSGVMMGKDL